MRYTRVHEGVGTDVAVGRHAGGIHSNFRAFCEAMSARCIQITERDREIAIFVVRFGAVTAEQVRRRFFGRRQVAYRRLAQLVGAGILRHDRVLFDAPGVYRVTPDGARLADVGLPVARLHPAALRHTLAVVDLMDNLSGEHPGATWMSERELRRTALSPRRARDGRLGYGGPAARVPDGILVLESGTRVAVELELSNKTTQAYDTVLGAPLVEPVDSVWWYVRSDRARARIAVVAEQYRFPAGYIELRPWHPVAAPVAPKGTGR